MNRSETEEEMQSETARQFMSDIGLSRENAEYVGFQSSLNLSEYNERVRR
jgi:hypothetical protein